MKNKLQIAIMILGLVLFGCTTEQNNNCGEQNPNPIGTVTDIDGNIYHTILIGTQTWMIENLKTTRYNNGDSIVNETGTWGTLTDPVYCDYDNDPINSGVYGRLYNYYAAVDSRNIAPTGWHVPSKEEWKTLRDYLGEYATFAMRVEGWNGCNTSGFSALPAGMKSTANYMLRGTFTGWWSTTGYDDYYASIVKLSGNPGEGYPSLAYKNEGYSIRCIKD